eukprot:CAMPEP_0206465530 /NCGR_PEP_ID=MMETSP0324_2-20121206/27888_1 /ASSEMBLY_ACC=CAM_ASM_000836 /TAXON_ID=2866 /ORGANISM="Crypthecodinium cohnii, Strain Seligo" /LENGTH=657 /DNA_ID=CAMNT_0053938413 /DNA_START=51 /DNA_END=2024 /DNA_ORIENTATION=+
MKVSLILSTLLPLAVAHEARVTPLQKVIELLANMESKGKTAKHNEEVEFAKFSQWCSSTQAASTKSIEEAASQIEMLTADIAKAEASAEELATEISELEASSNAHEAELKEATAVREKEHTDFVASENDLSESIDVIERAIAVLKSREADVPQKVPEATSLLEVRSDSALPREAKAVIDSFLSMSNGQAPLANAYEFQSGSVVGMLEKLRLKFQDQRLALQKAEMNAKNNFEVLSQGLTDNIKDESARAKDKTATKGARLEAAAVAKGDLTSTEKGKEEDEKTLEDTKSLCHSKSEIFEKNQVLRSEEIKAIQQASEILKSDDVTGNAGKYLPALPQVAGSALVQLRGQGNSQEIRDRLVNLLNSRAQASGSKYLALIATRAAADPFAKVKSMIKDLIVKLQEQANSEADHKGYCDAELAKNKATRENKESEVAELTAKIEKGEATSAKLAEELAALSDALSELAKSQAEATALRAEEKAENKQTVEDAQAAQVAVQKATKILKEFYASAAESFLQQHSKQEPYTGMQSEHGGIIGFLEVVLSDFARLEADTSSAEDQAASAYEKFMDETNQDIAVKNTESKHKESSKQDTDSQVISLKKDLELTQEELTAANEYYEKLKPDCVDLGLSYEDRVKMREEEVQSLKEALAILEQEDIA